MHGDKFCKNSGLDLKYSGQLIKQQSRDDATAKENSNWPSRVVAE